MLTHVPAYVREYVHRHVPEANTERARERVVEELNLQNLTDDEAVRLLELANDGVYDTEDMPGRWSSVFEEVEENFSREISFQTSDRDI